MDESIKLNKFKNKIPILNLCVNIVQKISKIKLQALERIKNFIIIATKVKIT